MRKISRLNRISQLFSDGNGKNESKDGEPFVDDTVLNFLSLSEQNSCEPKFGTDKGSSFLIISVDQQHIAAIARMRKISRFNRISQLFSNGNGKMNRKMENHLLTIPTTLPNNIDAYEIGLFNIGYGCNAAVYALKVRDNKNPSTSSSVGDIARSENAYSIQKYPLALKLMYNFALDLCPRLGDNFLWRSMGAELVPLPESANILNGKMGRYRPLPAFHPNVVRVLTAFVDRMPILDDAKLVYPDALPSAPFYEMLINEPRTMFVVMKRYRMTLREYVKDFRRKRSYHVARILFGQLLEGCVFLYENVVSQRDMKSDNILLEFDNPDDVPHLVISDFGCALATGSWVVKYVDDTIDLGGNTKTRAPEIILAQPGPDSFVDFRMADTWAVGTLAYEIFTRVNPFYTRLSSANYKEEDLPNLSPFITKPVRDVVHDLLRRNPAERLLPHIAANVISLSLLRLGGDFQSFFSSSGLNTVINKILDDVLFLISAETIASRSSTSGVISRAEQQVNFTATNFSI
ncbi:unnamed protein product [Haemonchus placei]|uniref:non-specific serine/threonine protein kinase n=1 Tax=Haemonchus placei TaxID=6290 RepID=A0A0N4W9N0_HAEPC|nr:unnamed protein product [Haemonchus placei]